MKEQIDGGGRPAQDELSESTVRALILGAGPTGLGAAHRLSELGCDDWLLLEQNDRVGGLASSFVDPQGFTWDLGVHVVFSHYDYFDSLLDGLFEGSEGNGWLHHRREAWVWMRERLIPYPLQQNLHLLPPEDLWKCLEGLMELGRKQMPPIEHFGDWIQAYFGSGLADVFMLPYNFKVWAHPALEMCHDWVGERVAPVTLRGVLKNLVFQQLQGNWGPNSTFRFPRRGGTGAIWSALGRRLPPHRVRFGRKVVAIDLRAKSVTTSAGEVVRYETLLSTIPLDTFCAQTEDAQLHEWSRQLVRTSTHIVGVGLEGHAPEALEKKSWLYFPEPEVPFYRATMFSNYSPYNVPKPGEQWSLICEVSESRHRPPLADVTGAVVDGLRGTGFVGEDETPVSLWHRRLPHGYPTPFLGRNATLGLIDNRLRAHQVHSRGRFGGWKYEVSNQDHSMMQGVEFAEFVCLDQPERTYYDPEAVNSRH
jgi:protoporphyrinogen oxidase